MSRLFSQLRAQEPMCKARRSLLSLGLLAPLMLSAPAALGQSWPQRTVKFLLPLGPGSGVDIGARLLADRLSARWGQPVVVENRPGGDGIVAIGAFVSAHDDHVLLMTPTSSFTAHPYLHANLPYKPSDLLPITRVSNTIITIAVPTSLRAGSLDQMLELVRAQPGKLNWAGVTGALDFLFAVFLQRKGLSMTKVPYRNPVEAANDLAEGRVHMYMAALAIVRPQLQTGNIKLLALTNSIRAPAAPDVPTVKEAGYGELTFDGLVGLFGPSDMPSEIRDRIAADIRSVVAADPMIGERLAATGQMLNIGGPAEFARATEEQRDKVTAIAHELGQEYARYLAGLGARVVIADVNDCGHTLKLVQAEKGAAISAKLDVANAASAMDMARTALDAFGRVDALINNAALFGGLKGGRFDTIAETEWDAAMAVNVKGIWNCCKAVVPAMRQAGGGSIVNIASLAATYGMPYGLHYTTSKAAVIGLTRGLARELGRDNIRVNALAPSAVLTEGAREFFAEKAEKALDTIRLGQAIARNLNPSDLLGAVHWLVSDSSQLVTGQTIAVDGGTVMH